MDLLDSDVLGLAERRLAWLEGRQTQLAANIANKDVPGYRATDSAPFVGSFSGALNLASARSGKSLQPARAEGAGAQSYPVELDREMIKVADTQTAQALATNIYSKYLSLFRLALGRSS